jgi:hypothetical protein
MPEDGAQVEVLGLPELAAGSTALFRRIDEGAPREFEHVAQRLAGEVRNRVPVLTGLLMGSVQATRSHQGVGVAMGGEGVPYAGWIEFGGTRGRPYIASGRYLYPVALRADPLLVAAGERAATSEIERAHWPKP